MQTIQKETQPFISFIIPAYNVPAEMLRECIESIRQLSLRPAEREIIIVDDGSDFSPVIKLADILDELIYIRQKNGGVATARNMGLKVASGTFIQFVDADDLLIRTPYEHVLDLVRYQHSDLVMFDFCEKPDNNTSYKDKGPFQSAAFLRSNNIHGSVWGLIFKRSIVGSLRFTPGIAYGEDEEFTPQLVLRADSVMTTDARAYCYRQRPSSAINRKDARSRLKRLNDAKAVLLRLRLKASTAPPEERIALQRRIAQLTMDYIYNVITLTRSRHYLDRRLDELRKADLFPLPDRNYTRKYTWFRRMTNSSLGLTVLMRTLPRIR